MLSSSPGLGCLMCPDCSNNTQPGTVPTTTHLSGPAAVLQAEYSRLVRLRGAGGNCAACAALFAQGQPVAVATQGSSNINSSSRYPTDPLPQQQLRQQQNRPPWEMGATPAVSAISVFDWRGREGQWTPAEPCHISTLSVVLVRSQYTPDSIIASHSSDCRACSSIGREPGYLFVAATPHKPEWSTRERHACTPCQ